LQHGSDPLRLLTLNEGLRGGTHDSAAATTDENGLELLGVDEFIDRRSSNIQQPRGLLDRVEDRFRFGGAFHLRSSVFIHVDARSIAQFD
jgi:hypothetical protein